MSIANEIVKRMRAMSRNHAKAPRLPEYVERCALHGCAPTPAALLERWCEAEHDEYDGDEN